MQFKPRKNKALSFDVRRWVYDETKKRSNAVHIGTLNIRQPEIPPILLGKCSPPEQNEIQQFWKSMKEGVEKERLKNISSSFIQLCRDIEQSLKNNLLSDDDKNKIYDELRIILKKLR